jgi:nucleotide-binding universal stress UspA family protein
VGDIAGEISQLANKIKADLILIGTQNGELRKVLLGSVANTILNCVKQDVLAVRTNNNSRIT